MSTAHFQQLYEQADDPWQVRQRWYEQRKRSLLLASLPAPRYRHIFEPACGNGELTAALSERADRITASDVSPAAVALTRRRITTVNARQVATVEVQCQHLPGEWPSEQFDLIVISEMAYYLPPTDLPLLLERCLRTLAPGGAVVLCHWRRPFADRLLDTDAIHAAFNASPALHRIVNHQEADFLLDVWSNNPHSVAQHEGISP